MSSSSTASSSRALQGVLKRTYNPSILPIPRRTTGNNVPKSLHKTRRDWHANVSRMDMHLTVPSAFASSASSSSSSQGENVLRGVKIQTRRKKDVEKGGGLEGMLLSRPAKHFTPFGKQLRSALFEELHRIRAAAHQDSLETDTSVNDAPLLAAPASPSSPHTTSGESIPTGPGR